MDHRLTAAHDVSRTMKPALRSHTATTVSNAAPKKFDHRYNP
jgi:hypothetical protein